MDASSRANTNAPTDGSPWSSVGTINGLSGVYVGAGWVLTAVHVGTGNADFGGTTYPYDGTTVRMTNSDGSGTDLQLLHLATRPPLPRMPLVTSTPAALAVVDMIGFGHIAGSAQTNFGSYTGFYWSANGYKSWGNNKANGGTTVYDIGQGNVTAFTTTFSASPGQTSDEAQASPGDSGGGVFYKSGSIWQLAGILDSIGTFSNQPANTSVYSDVTYAVDVATYQAQIVAVMAATRPELSVARTGANLLLSWPDNGVTYSLLGKNNLTNSTWNTLSPALTLTNGQFQAMVSPTNRTTFFRLRNP